MRDTPFRHDARRTDTGSWDRGAHPHVAGERSSEVIAGYGFHRSTIYGWCKAERGRDNGLRALASCRRRYVQVLWQARQVLRWVNGKNPRQYGFDIGLWTRHIVREVGEAAILSALESSLDRRGACQTKSDTAEATAARLPTRSRRDGTLAARDLPRDLRPSQVGRRRNLLLGRVGRSRQCGVWNDVGPRDSRRSDRCSASVRAPAPRRLSGRPCKGVRVGKPSNMCATAQTTDGC